MMGLPAGTRIWLAVGATWSAYDPECTGPVMTASPGWPDHGLRLPVSKPPLTRLPDPPPPPPEPVTVSV